MNTLQTSYQAVIEHIAADIENLRPNGHAADTENLNALQTNREWLMCRMNRLNERREQIINGFGKRLEAYLFLCENFWKERHGRTYENRMDDLLAVKKEVAGIHSLTGFDACYALLLMLKRLRSILPPRQYDEHAPALTALESIKSECQRQMATYIKV
jgi:hypothetical protein